MTTIADKLASIYNSKIAIKDAIETKGVPVEDAPLDDYADKILSIPTGSVEEDYDVEFIDYDGELLIGMSKEEFLALEELPNNPATHENLISDGWNWTFADAYAYVNKYGALVIGALYTTKNDASWVTLNLDDEALLRDVPVYFKQSVSQGTLVDWGDGTSERFAGTSYTSHYHTYSQIGTYTITLTPDDGCVLDITSGGEDFNTYDQGPRTKWGMRRSHIVIGKVGTTTRMFYLGFDLLDIVVPRGITLSPANIFRPFNLRGLVLPPSISTIAANSFAGIYNLKRLSFSKGVTAYTGSCFAYCYAIDKIIIPDTITTIAASAFAYCYNVKKIIIPDSVTFIDGSVFRNCYYLTEVYFSKALTSIGTYAFYYCLNLKEIILQDTITSIGTYAFYNCLNLKEIILPDTITSVGNNAFEGCYAASRIKLSDSMTVINASSFISCYNAKEIVLPKYVTTINGSAFYNCNNLSSIAFPESLTSIGNNSFYNCWSLEEIILPDTVTTLGNSAFYNCYSAKRIKLSNSLTVIPDSCFNNCNSVKEITIPNGVTAIQNYGFRYCYLLQEISLPESLITIGTSTFQCCYNVETLTIPKNVTSIGNGAFQCYPYYTGYYNKLRELHMKPATPPTLTQAAYSTNNSVFSFSGTADIKVYVPQGSLSAYQTATNWTMLAEYMIEEEEEE